MEYEEANAYAEENGLLFMETSAKNANNINEIFLAIARKLPDDSVPEHQDTVKPGQNGVQKGNKTCCNR